jgi:hypothetical protein
VLIEPKSYSPTRASCCPVQRSKCDGGGDDLDIITDETWLSIRGIRVNGYGTGTINQIYRPLGLGIIRPDKNSVAFVIFTATAVHGGLEGFQRLSEGDPVKFRLFSDEIAGARFASDVWLNTP